MKKNTIQKRFFLTILILLFFTAANAQYLETFSTPNKGYVFNNVDDFTEVNWTLSPWDPTYRLYDDYFQTFDGKLNGEEFDQEVCWQGPLLDISTAGAVSFSVDLSWQNFDAGDYMSLEYDINGSGLFTSVPNVVGGGTRTIEYTSGSNSGSTTISVNSLSGNTLRLKVCIFTNDTLEYTTIDNVSVPNSGVSTACEGDVVLGSQADVDAFDCSLITGSLTINGADITDLSPLASLTSVGGDFTLFSNPAITSLDGLSSLASVGGSLTMNTNSNLSNLDGLSFLNSVGGDITLLTNLALTSLDGLSSLTTVGGLISITSNSSLSNLDGLSSLTSVGGDFLIVNNNVLTEYCGLFNLLNGGGLTGSFITQSNQVNPSQQDIIDGGPCPDVCAGNVTLSTQAQVDAFTCNIVNGNLTIEGADITDLSPLTSLTSVGGFLSIDYNSALSNLDGFSSLTSVGGYLYIRYNAALSNLDGLSSLTSLGGSLNIQGNTNLTNLDGLSSLSSVGGILKIYYNAALTNLGGLSFLSSVEAYLQINENAVLTNLDGLSSLASVGGYLEINENAVLSNLDGLSSLTSVGGHISINNNASLTNLDGLSSLALVGTNLSITDNSALTEFCGLYPLLVGGGLSGSFFRFGNAENPTQQEIIDEGPCCDIQINSVTMSDEGCPGANDGYISITASCTTCTSIEYSVDGSNYQSGNEFTSLSPGSYTVYVRDADHHDCNDSFSGSYINPGIDNTAPSITCPADITVSNDAGSCDAVVTFSVSASDNCDPTPNVVCTPASGSTFPVGTTTVTCVATDASGNSNNCSFDVTVNDEEAPVLTAVSTPLALWPPNHKYVTINLEQLFESVSDNCSSLSIDNVYIASASSDEAEDGDNDGATLNDIVIGENCGSVQLRAERDGEGNGRVYTINLAVEDDNGNIGTAEAYVYVPVNKNGSATDDGVTYEVECNKSAFASFAGDDIQLKNYPNPFNGSTTIAFTLTETENTTLKVYDTFGKEVATLFDDMAQSGQQYTVEFNGENLPKGIYVYHLKSGTDLSVVKKMILMK